MEQQKPPEDEQCCAYPNLQLVTIGPVLIDGETWTGVLSKCSRCGLLVLQHPDEVLR